MGWGYCTHTHLKNATFRLRRAALELLQFSAIVWNVGSRKINKQWSRDLLYPIGAPINQINLHWILLANYKGYCGLENIFSCVWIFCFECIICINISLCVSVGIEIYRYDWCFIRTTYGCPLTALVVPHFLFLAMTTRRLLVGGYMTSYLCITRMKREPPEGFPPRWIAYWFLT